MLQAGEPAQDRSVHASALGNLILDLSQGGDTGHRKLAFIISRAQEVTCFLFNSNSCADLETNVATRTTKRSVVVLIILCTCFLYLFQI